MAEKNSLSGKVVGINVQDPETLEMKWLDCQVDATLNLTTDTEEEESCKPSPDEIATIGDVPYGEFTASKRTWDISVSQKIVKGIFEAAGIDIADLWVQGLLNVQVEFMTNPNQEVFAYDIVYSGAAIITGYTFNAPETGASTADITLQGTGEITRNVVPRTS